MHKGIKIYLWIAGTVVVVLLMIKGCQGCGEDRVVTTDRTVSRVDRKAKPTQRSRIPAKPTQRSRIPRSEFTAKAIGMTTDQLIKYVGRPESTQNSARGGRSLEFWYYKKLTIDPNSQKLDYSIQIIIISGRVAEIRY